MKKVQTCQQLVNLNCEFRICLNELKYKLHLIKLLGKAYTN